MYFVEEVPLTYQKGQNFENFVEQFMFPKNKYALVRRTDTYERNLDRLSEDSLGPDRIFRCLKTGKEFGVEIKYRSGHFKGKLFWAKNEDQMNRYQAYDTKMPVFVAVGYRGSSTSPEELFLFPVRTVWSIDLYFNFVRKYKLDKPEIDNDFLWQLYEKINKNFS